MTTPDLQTPDPQIPEHQTKDPHQSAPEFFISDLCDMLEGYMEPRHVAEVYQAFLFAAEAHEGQHRQTGEPYIYHPVHAAQVLAEMGMDHQTIMAAILHDVIEDTPTAKEHLEEVFGAEVAELVDGVSKLDHVHFESKAEAQAESFRKMVMAMTRDLRVVLVKLADRMHNMRTLEGMRPEKRRRIASETLEIYAPIAERLGLNEIRLELEDLGFRNMYPMRYRVLQDAIQKARGNRKEVVERIGDTVRERLLQEGVEGKVEGREKHLYSTYRKMRQKHLSFHDVFDIYALRIVVESVDECYRTLGVVHNLYKPVPGKFKDYIAIPKANGYQSLHTVLFSPYGVPIEIQIRTRDMDRVANVGVAAHWWYKNREGDNSVSGAQQRAREWLRGLLEMQQVAGNSIEFLENVKIDLFPDEVYVFTPKGEIMELPRGATAVDFAYMVHTDVGNSCVAAKIDRRLFPLNTELRNGQTVEIVTAPNARPNPAWLNFVATAKARSNIRSFLKHMQREESISLGQRLLDKHLAVANLTCETVDPQRFDALLEELGLPDRDSLYIDIGLGSRLPQLVARNLLPVQETTTEAVNNSANGKPLLISGTEGMVLQFARCCRPIPGDQILGYITTGRGIVIHNKLCKNLGDFRKNADKWIDLAWEPDVEGEFPVDVRVDVANRRGVLATVAASIARMDANIENVEMEERDGLHTALNLTISVHDRRHLAAIMRRVKHLDCVSRIHRRHQ